MSALVALVDLFAVFPIFAEGDGDGLAFLAAGPIVGGAVYGGLYRYYRNTDKSHSFERETTVVSQPVTGNDMKVDEVKRTKRRSIPGDNRDDHRERVQRIS